MMNATVSVLFYLVGVLLLLVLSAFLGFTAYLYYVRRKLSHIPSPKQPSFYMGHLPDVLSAQKESGNEELPIQDSIHKWYQDVGSTTFVVNFYFIPIVVVMDPEDIEKLTLQTSSDKPQAYVQPIKSLFGERFLGDSILSIIDYETWKPRRKLYNSAFNKSYLKTLIRPFNQSVDKMLERLKPLADGKTLVPMKLHLAELALDVISKVAFGMDFTEKWNAQTLGLKHSKGNGSLSFLVSHCFKGVDKTFPTPYLYQCLHPFETEGYREAVRAIRMIGRDCIKRRIENIESGEQVPNDVLTHILQRASTKDSVNIEELVDDFVAFYVAGQQSTTHLLAFSIVLLHQHPHSLERLQSEVTEVLGTKDAVTNDDLQKLHYTEQVLMESLRMYPPIFGTCKCARKGGITLGGYHIPAGCQILISNAVLCRMSEYFDDPGTFNPERWDNENQKPNPFVYFPFGLGHRSCIAKHFAMMESKIALARIIQTYKITLPADYKLIAAQRTTLQPKGDVPCTIISHNN